MFFWGGGVHPWRTSLFNHRCIHRVQQISGQEDLSQTSHSHRLYAPLWPSSLGITDGCQHATVKDMSESQKPGHCLLWHFIFVILIPGKSFSLLLFNHRSPHFLCYIGSSCVGTHQYGHDFMQRLRFCPAARVRPVDLERIPGVTLDTPGTADSQRKKHNVTLHRHGLNIWVFFLLMHRRFEGKSIV